MPLSGDWEQAKIYVGEKLTELHGDQKELERTVNELKLTTTKALYEQTIELKREINEVSKGLVKITTIQTAAISIVVPLIIWVIEHFKR